MQVSAKSKCQQGAIPVLLTLVALAVMTVGVVAGSAFTAQSDSIKLFGFASSSSSDNTICIDNHKMWASAVIEADQGLLETGQSINSQDSLRTNPNFVLGPADGPASGTFFSLGKQMEGHKGLLSARFDNAVVDSPGPDIAVHEITWNRMNYFSEKAIVEVSADGTNWSYVGTADNHASENGINYFDIATTGIPAISFVRLVDQSDYLGTSPNIARDGYDIDAIEAITRNCQTAGQPTSGVVPPLSPTTQFNFGTPVVRILTQPQEIEITDSQNPTLIPTIFNPRFTPVPTNRLISTPIISKVSPTTVKISSPVVQQTPRSPTNINTPIIALSPTPRPSTSIFLTPIPTDPVTFETPKLSFPSETPGIDEPTPELPSNTPTPPPPACRITCEAIDLGVTTPSGLTCMEIEQPCLLGRIAEFVGLESEPFCGQVREWVNAQCPQSEDCRCIEPTPTILFTPIPTSPELTRIPTELFKVTPIEGLTPIPVPSFGEPEPSLPFIPNPTIRIPSPTTVPNLISCREADINGDGLVNGSDYSLILVRLGSRYLGADINRDGIVDSKDTSIVIGCLGQSIE